MPRLQSARSVLFVVLAATLVISMIFVVGNTLTQSSAVSSSQPNFGAMNLSNDNNNASYPWVANVGSHVYVAWTEEDHGIYFRMSPDNGTSWYPPVSQPGTRISSPGGVAGYPIIAANQSNVYVTWSQTVDTYGAMVGQIFVAASTDYGQSFSPAQQLTSGYSQNGFITPVIATSGQYVYIAYTADGKQSFVVSSTNYGAPGSWTTPFHFAVTHEPQITAWGAYGYVVADGPQYAVTNNGGESWTEVMNYTGRGDEPFIASSGSYVYIVSQTKTANGTIHFITCSNYGMSCNPNMPPGNQISYGVNDSWEPQIAASGNYVYIVFHNVIAPISNWITVSANNGQTWSAPIDVSGSSGMPGWATQITTSGCGGGYSCSTNASNYVFTQWPVYSPLTNEYYIYTSISSDYGATWTAAPGVEVSNNIAYSSIGPNDIATSSAAAFGNHEFIAWTMCQQCGQNHNVTLDNSQIIFAVSYPSSGFGTTSTTGSGSSVGSTTTTISESSSKSSTQVSSSSHASTIVVSSTKTSSTRSTSSTIISSTVAATTSSSLSSTLSKATSLADITTSQSPHDLYVAALLAAALGAAGAIVYVFGFRKSENAASTHFKTPV